MSEYTIGQELSNMISAPKGTSTPKTIFKSEDGILLCYGTTAPSDDAVGYAPGCIFLDVNGSSTTTVVAVNIGTALLADFDYKTID